MVRLAWLVGLLVVALAAAAQPRDRTFTLAAAQTATETRHALVIGNSAYSQAPLRNPVNDARAIARALRDSGFNVLLVEDASQLTVQRAIRTFGDQIAKGGVGLFYFAGHGIQAKGRNYLVPVNAEIVREDEIEFIAVDVNLVLAKMDSAKNALNIVILDACRNNPFTRSFRSVQTGLAQMDAPTGSFIAFATAPGSVAADGAGEHGIYTKHLLAEMSRPGMPIEQLFKQVRIGVMQDTGGQQIPWESSSLRGEFAFRAAPPAAGAPAGAASVAEMERMIRAALDAQRKGSDAVELAFWESVRNSNDAGDYRAYLEQYPQGKFSSLARNRMAALGQKLPAVKPAPGAPPVVVASVRPTPSAAPGAPAEGDSWTYELVRRDPATRKSLYMVKVQAATADAILEQFQLGDETMRQWAHARGPAVVNLGVSVFSPYLALLGEPVPGTRLRVDNLDNRTCGAGWSCSVSGRVVGYDRVRVPAGTFDALRIEISQSWTSQSQTNDRGEMGGRTLSVWYAPQAKRAVKFSSRGNQSRFIDTDFDLELVSYQLK